jgi:hypothetical protein
MGYEIIGLQEADFPQLLPNNPVCEGEESAVGRNARALQTLAMHQAPITISTIADLAANAYRLALYCLPCDRWLEIDPARCVASGRGDIEYTRATFRCRDCGEVASKQVRSMNVEQVSSVAAY